MKGTVGFDSAASGLWDVGLWEPRQATGAMEVRGRLSLKAVSFTSTAGPKAHREAGRKLRVWSQIFLFFRQPVLHVQTLGKASAGK